MTVTRALSSESADNADNVVTNTSISENANYSALPYIDVNDKKQIKSIRKSDGQVTILTSGSYSAFDPYLTSGDKVVFYDEQDSLLKHIAVMGGTRYRVEPKPEIVCWGDSMTAGAGGGGTTYPNVLASLSGRTVTNKGIGGQTSTQIVARQGGQPITVNVTSAQIPASGGVSVTSKNINILYNSGSFTGSSTGTLVGVAGTMTTDGSGNWTFTRTASGSIVNCPNGSQFIPDDALTYQEHTVVMWIGRNNAQGGYTTLGDAQALRDYLKTLYKRTIVLAICNGAGEFTGTAQHTSITSQNTAFAAEFGANYIDIRRLIIDNALTIMSGAGITPNSQDTTDIAGDTIPVSLRSDSVHFLAPVYTYIAGLVNDKINQLGW
jgi:hypothetical protein